MNKSELISYMASEQDCSKEEALNIVNKFTATITSALAAGNEVSLVGFGNFSVSSIDARKGRNPQTGKEIDIPAYKQPKFKAGKLLKEACNK